MGLDINADVMHQKRKKGRDKKRQKERKRKVMKEEKKNSVWKGILAMKPEISDKIKYPLCAAE